MLHVIIIFYNADNYFFTIICSNYCISLGYCGDSFLDLMETWFRFIGMMELIVWNLYRERVCDGCG